MAREGGIGFQDTVGGRVVACCVHGIGARLVKGGRESHIARVPAGDGDFWHGRGVATAILVVAGLVFLRSMLQIRVNWSSKLMDR